MDPLRIRIVVADDEVRIAVAIEVGQRRGVGPVRRAADRVTAGEAPGAVVQQHEVVERPVAALRQHQVEVPVPVEVPGGDPGARRALFLEHHRQEARLRHRPGRRQRHRRARHCPHEERRPPRRAGQSAKKSAKHDVAGTANERSPSG